MGQQVIYNTHGQQDAANSQVVLRNSVEIHWSQMYIMMVITVTCIDANMI